MLCELYFNKAVILKSCQHDIKDYCGMKRYASQLLHKLLKILYEKEIQHLSRHLPNFLLLKTDYKEAEEMKGKRYLVLCTAPWDILLGAKIMLWFRSVRKYFFKNTFYSSMS